MKLRRWQAEAVQSALTKYATPNPHFLCLATPGAGKTVMASVVAQKLMAAGKIDLVFCFSPSVNVATSFQESLETHLNSRFDGLLGAKGRSLTYQSMLNLKETFWSLLTQCKTLVIFDEIHHCAGDHEGNANAWGQQIIRNIQGRATYTLALTGTPWRSDNIPIALSTYCHQGKIQCDYTYGLDLAIQDQVCRTPKIVAIDNEQITLLSDQGEQHFDSFSALLKESKCPYQQLLDNTALITHLVRLSAKKLATIRRTEADAGALIVAASVEHALKIADIVREETGDAVHLVTYLHENAQSTIRHFRETRDKWIVSVGMISEGTDIPRLKVCCHLTRVKTELYFRQVLGRILRTRGQPNDDGYLFMPAEPNLILYAKRVAEDVPASKTVTVEAMPQVPPQNEAAPLDSPSPPSAGGMEIAIAPTDSPYPVGARDEKSDEANEPPHPPTSLSDVYDSTIGLFGRFRQKMIRLSTREFANPPS